MPDMAGVSRMATWGAAREPSKRRCATVWYVMVDRMVRDGGERRPQSLRLSMAYIILSVFGSDTFINLG